MAIQESPQPEVAAEVAPLKPLLPVAQVLEGLAGERPRQW